ncbi:MAG: flagellar basal body rod protein FlgB [Halobacteriovoraceae bacterium]|nr:flagellar basal body rod protein FlgB [Halobacteriovoraceae bacterium]
MKGDSVTLKTLAMAIKYRQMRQEILSANIANAETPGYKTKRLDFEDALADAIDVEDLKRMNVTSDKHYNVGSGGFDTLSPEIYEESNGIVSEDDNNVDREKEMALMAENKIMYDATIQLLNKKIALKKYAISTER